MKTQIHAVTGAFGYSGKYITERLLAQGHTVRTLTNSRQPNPFGAKIEVHPLNFDDAAGLATALQGVQVLYNTYWVRFNHQNFSHQQAVENTLKLFDAAKAAGVARVVHTSITNPTDALPLSYFKGKLALEQALQQSGLAYTILRPAVLFGEEDILINNIAWALRRLPVFGVFGDGSYRLQPIYIHDFADLAVRRGQATGNEIIEAIGPETFTYRELAQSIAQIIGVKRLIIGVPPSVGYWAGRLVGRLVGDVFITRDEVTGLMADLLCVDAPPAGSTHLTNWATTHADTLGRQYAHELARRR